MINKNVEVLVQVFKHHPPVVNRVFPKMLQIHQLIISLNQKKEKLAAVVLNPHLKAMMK